MGTPAKTGMSEGSHIFFTGNDILEKKYPGENLPLRFLYLMVKEEDAENILFRRDVTTLLAALEPVVLGYPHQNVFFLVKV